MALKITKKALELPSEVSTPGGGLGDFTWLIYGERKIGKTSLAAEFPDALFLMFEPGGKGLAIYQTPITSWQDFKDCVRLLKDTDQFKTVVIDTIDIAYELALMYTGSREGFSHPSDNKDFGKSWQQVRLEFSSGIKELADTGRGIIFLSHAKEIEFQPERGAKFNKVIPNIATQARTFISGFVDVIAFYGYHGVDRWLTIHGSDRIDAGHRIVGHFQIEKEGEKPKAVHCIPMGDSPQEGFSNIQLAFDNGQEDPNVPNMDPTLSTPGNTSR